jgi:3-dehydroquinate dehydratase-2
LSEKSQHILIINGPNLNLLGRREKSIYGDVSFESYIEELDIAFPDVEIGYFQSNYEGAIIDKIHEVGFDAVGIVINAGAYTHTSIAIRDAISGVEIPVVEVHISNIYKRESFRWQNFLSDVCVHSIIGKGLDGYREAIEYLIQSDTH